MIVKKGGGGGVKWWRNYLMFNPIKVILFIKHIIL